jgi:hypothetical protein
VRRLVALFVIALVGATFYGLSSASSGLMVNNQHVSPSTLRTELAAISQNPNLECYINALNAADYKPGAGGYSVAASGAAAWSNLRVEGLAIDQYVTTKLKHHPSARELASAKSSLEGEMTQQAASNSASCPGTAAEALAAMPPEMRQAQIEDQATSLYLVSTLQKTIPLTAASMQSYYTKHTSSYDTLCIAVAVVAPSDIQAFNAAQAAGATVAQLAEHYSVDASSSTGGAYGCYPPTSSSYADVRSDVAGLALNQFPTTPASISYNGGTYGLYVAVTKRTTTPFAQASAQVLRDLENLNAASASDLRNALLYEAAVHVDPAFGRWGLSSNGPSVFAPALPSVVGLTGAAQLASASSTYK